jgi:hypothetical protein
MRALVAVLTLALAAPAAAHPCPGAKPKKTATKKAATLGAPTAEQVMQHYQRTGLALRSAHHVASAATEPLFMRYRLVNLNEAIRTPDKRAAAIATLDQLDADVKRLIP